MIHLCPPSLATVAPLAFLEGIGAGEMLLVAVIGLLLFGGKGLPDMARTLGKAVREFKKATANVEEEVRRVMNEEPAPAPKPKPRPKPAAALEASAPTEAAPSTPAPVPTPAPQTVAAASIPPPPASPPPA